MKHYETLILFDPQADESSIENIENHIKSLVKEANGSTSSFDKWGKFRLAYPIRKQEYGIYSLARFSFDSEAQPLLKKLESYLKVKCVDKVMRHVSVRLTDSQFSAPYARPESLEQAAAHGDKREGREDRRGGRGFRSERPAAAPAAPAVEAVADVVAENATSEEAEG